MGRAQLRKIGGQLLDVIIGRRMRGIGREPGLEGGLLLAGQRAFLLANHPINGGVVGAFGRAAVRAHDNGRPIGMGILFSFRSSSTYSTTRQKGKMARLPKENQPSAARER